MGYSIAIRAKNKALQQKMFAFMQANYRNWPTVKGNPNGNAYVGSPTDDLSYDHNSRAIGLDYGAVSDWEREYAYAIVRWMALKVGSLKTTFRQTSVKKTETPVPFIVYDGYESWPIFVVGSAEEARAMPKERQWCCYTKLGMHADPIEYVGGSLTIELAENFATMMNEIHDKIGARSPDGGDHAAWVAERHRLMLPHCQKKLDEQVQPLLKEMQRLDDLWSKL